jgi:hypothetical protein
MKESEPNKHRDGRDSKQTKINKHVGESEPKKHIDGRDSKQA